MKIKICGITNREDAFTAVEAGADALGFVFYPKSPRYITPKKAKEIIKTLPPFIERVGLFVNVESDFVNRIYEEVGISLAQIHFEADEEFYRNLRVKYIKVNRLKKREDIFKFRDEYHFVDAFVKEYGGVGKRLNLEWFKDIDCSKIILAGGLTPENVIEVKKYNFYGVDVSSGVEKSKGIKDREKIKKFIEVVKNA